MTTSASTAAAGSGGESRLAGDAGEPPSRAYRDLHTGRLLAATGAARRRMGTLRAYLRLVNERWWFFPVVWLLQNCRHSPVVIFPLLQGYLIDRLTEKRFDAALQALWWVLPITAFLCLQNVATTVTGRWLLSRQKRMLTAGLRRALMRRLHRLTFVYHDRARAGELQNKFVLDCNRLEELQNYVSEALILQGTTVLVVLGIIAWMNPWFLLVIAAVVPANLAVARWLWHPMRQRSEEFRKAESGFVAFLHEALGGLRLTRAHAVEGFAERRIGAAADEVASKGLRVDITTAFFGSSAWAISSFLQMVVVGLGVWLVARDGLTVGAFVIFLSYYIQVSSGMNAILNGMPAVAAANDAISSLTELFHAETEPGDAGKPAIEQLRGEVRLDAVRFAYPGSPRHSVDGVDLEVPAGRSLALVGPSGSGKSTIASLVLGFYEPQAGAVTIDGRDLRAIDRRSLRRQVGVVSQDVVLFHDSVLGNIAWGDPAPDRARALEAARRANALEFISRLPDGIDTQLGDRGNGLSGGQRQRLAIARALYRDPRLLILDEATSALDPESERLVQQALDELMKGRTTIIIAHRLSTVRHADRIVVLEEGRIAEQGGFDELMQRRGAFWRLALGQLA